MFGRRKREKYEAEASQIIFDVACKPHRGEILDECPSDVERRSLCLQWAGELRTQWYDGQRAQIIAVIESTDLRYRHYPPAVRRSIAEQQWSRSVQAKEMAATEQMYSRWARQYAGGAGA
jgi:hypothetical protein